MFVGRTLNLLRGLGSTLEVRHSYMKSMVPFAPERGCSLVKRGCSLVKRGCSLVKTRLSVVVEARQVVEARAAARADKTCC
jgi:hypothetical protein